MKKIVMMLIAGLFLVGLTSTASAYTLNTAFIPDISGGLVATTNALNYDLTGTTVLGTITQSVYSNPTGLLFVFDLNTTGPATSGAVSSLNTSNYGSYVVDVGLSLIHI